MHMIDMNVYGKINIYGMYTEFLNLIFFK